MTDVMEFDHATGVIDTHRRQGGTNRREIPNRRHCLRSDPNSYVMAPPRKKKNKDKQHSRREIVYSEVAHVHGNVVLVGQLVRRFVHSSVLCDHSLAHLEERRLFDYDTLRLIITSQ